MQRSTQLELTYRVYFKLSRSVTQMFDTMRGLFLRSSKWCNRVHFSEGLDILTPISPAKVTEHKELGFLVFESEGLHSLSLAQLVILIDCEREEVDAVLDELAEDFGDVFACIRFIENYLTEVVGI
jgi:hypothetical protein